MKYLTHIKSLILACFCMGISSVNTVTAQDKPTIIYGQSHSYPIGGITVEVTNEGAQKYEDYILIGISGLNVGDNITVPGDDITEAVKRYWKHGLFSDVRIEASEIRNDSIFLNIVLGIRPRVSEVNIYGVKKNEREDLADKIGIVKGNQITPNMVDRAKIIIERYFEDKGFKNAEVEIVQKDDIAHNDQLIVDVNINKNEKVKVNKIYITGNEHISRKKFMGGFFSGGLLKKTNEKGIKSLLKSKKFIAEKYEEDKERVIEKYNELGYRDAIIESDSVVDLGNNLVDIYINIYEGQKYYLRNVSWVGNTIYNSDAMSEVLSMKRGDVYNQKKLNERLNSDDTSIGNQYYNHGYVFSRIEPKEEEIDGDSIDLVIYVTEGKQASINKIQIYGNDKVYEEVVRRELKLKPGDLFTMDAFKTTAQEIAQMGHFDPEALDPNKWIKADQQNGTVDLSIGLTPKPSDQVEFSLGWGQTGIIGKLGLKFSNFSMQNLFGKNKARRGILPQGHGQLFELSGSTNGSYYQSYSVSFSDPWFGGKRPTRLSVSAFYSRQTDVNSSYYNSNYYNSYYSMLYGQGNYNSTYYNNYSSYYDPDKYIQLFGLSVGWGKRLNWPDNNFYLNASLAYTRYMLKDWEYFLITNGNCNNINLTLQLIRSSIGATFFPRHGSEISLSVSATPPYSLWEGTDYSKLATSTSDANYQRDLQKKYRWIEYHKWKFNSKLYIPLSGAKKCFVLMARLDAGFLGHYNKDKRSPFETFYVGGDGMSGYSTSYYSETIGLRGYENGALTPSVGSEGYAYTRMTMELRYPLLLEGSTNIYALAFLEGGNAWNDIRKFNPFDIKRSAGIGVRLFLPMVGLMGIDYAYGFDKAFGSSSYGGGHFHFVLGQEF
ncbi:MAG: outer membrane protein assembly factor BamA [Bacteroidaceae bacterium]|nr:outer membrane protein assembly factor BamA [Bacteroidaceae bacterium]